MAGVDESGEPLACLDAYKGGCAGAVAMRDGMSATGESFPRCDAHFDARLKEQERIDREYAPDSDVPPQWWSDLAPEDRMESWDEE